MRGAAWQTDTGSLFNSVMGGVLVSIENRFAELLNVWGYIRYKPVALQVAVAVMLQNCRGIWYGSQMTSLMGACRSALCDGLTVLVYPVRAA